MFAGAVRYMGRWKVRKAKEITLSNACIRDHLRKKGCIATFEERVLILTGTTSRGCRTYVFFTGDNVCGIREHKSMNRCSIEEGEADDLTILENERRQSSPRTIQRCKFNCTFPIELLPLEAVRHPPLYW